MPKYIYNNEDITLDVIMKIENVVRLLSKQNNISFDEMLGKFYQSKTYKALANTKSCMWAESAEFIVDDYCRNK